MSRVLLLLVVLSSGCKTAEFAVDHQMTGIHVAAKFEAKDGSRDFQPGPAASGLASADLGASHQQWNGGDESTPLRR